MCHEIHLDRHTEDDVPEQYWEAANALPSPFTLPPSFGSKKLGIIQTPHVWYLHGPHFGGEYAVVQRTNTPGWFRIAELPRMQDVDIQLNGLITHTTRVVAGIHLHNNFKWLDTLDNLTPPIPHQITTLAAYHPDSVLFGDATTLSVTDLFVYLPFDAPIFTTGVYGPDSHHPRFSVLTYFQGCNHGHIGSLNKREVLRLFRRLLTKDELTRLLSWLRGGYKKASRIYFDLSDSDIEFYVNRDLD